MTVKSLDRMGFVIEPSGVFILLMLKPTLAAKLDVTVTLAVISRYSVLLGSPLLLCAQLERTFGGTPALLTNGCEVRANVT
jgi:hypothetical protein